MKFILFFLLCVAFPTSSQDKLIFKVSFGEHNNPPYAIIENGKLVSGIIKNIIDAMSAELNVDIEYIYTPRKREERYLQNHKIDITVISNPSWLENSEQYLWSNPLFLEKDILVTVREKHLKINGLADLEQMTIGTILGYSYPVLDKLFLENKLMRSDVNRLNLNFHRLSKGWIDSFVDSNILIQYHLRNIPSPEQYEIQNFIVSEHNIQAALSVHSSVTLVQFNQALASLKAAGIINGILVKYQVL
jgi:polar amino acid transport system substrate-binding protein